MSSRLYNGTVFEFDSSPVGKLVGLAYSIGGQWIDVTEPEDLNKLFEFTTQPEFALKLKFKRRHSLIAGAKGEAEIVWSDGETVTCPGTWQVGPCEYSGDWDAPVTSTAELRPTVPDES